MHFISVLSALIASVLLVSAAPADNGAVQAHENLRLLETSENDPETWLTADEKTANHFLSTPLEKFRSKVFPDANYPTDTSSGGECVGRASLRD
jgi:hypothetical protein